MLPILNLTSDPNQSMTIVLPDGSKLVISLSYVASQTGWFYTSIVNSAQGFQLGITRVCVIPNALRQFKNLINFGLTCITQTGREPTQLEDLSSGAFQLYVLTQAEVQQYEAALKAGQLA
jgi:hypothetical protein